MFANLLKAALRRPHATLRLPLIDGLRATAKFARDTLTADRERVAHAVQTTLPDDIRLLAPDHSAETAGLHAAPAADAGHQALRVYFAQLRSPAGVFLDLSPGSFGMDPGGAGPGFVWRPGPAVLRLPEHLRGGMQALYAALYAGDEVDRTAFLIGLERMGLLESLRASAHSAVVDVFIDHVGVAAAGGRARFELEHFLARYPLLLDRLDAIGVSPPPDFAVAGLYFLALYAALYGSRAEDGFAVQTAYREAIHEMQEENG